MVPAGVDILLHPTFPADEWAKLKQRQLVGLRKQRTSPQFLSRERFNKAVFGSHPAAIISATPASLEAITVEAMKKWHDERYVPQNAILGIAGDVTAAQIMPKLQAPWPPGKRPTSKPAGASPVTRGRGKARDDRQPRRLRADQPADGQYRHRPPQSRLCPVRRDESGVGRRQHGPAVQQSPRGQGLHLRGVQQSSAGEYAGPWEASSEVRTEVTEGAMREFFNEFNRIRDEKVPSAELEEEALRGGALRLVSRKPAAACSASLCTRKVYDLPETIGIPIRRRFPP